MPSSDTDAKSRSGRKSKGDRHAFRLRIPRDEAILVINESNALQTSCNDYLAHLVGRALGFSLPMERVPHNRTTVEMVTEDVHIFMIRILRLVANQVIADADRLGLAKADYVVRLVCHELNGSKPLPNREDQEVMDLQTAS